MNRKVLAELISRYNAGTATSDEIRLLEKLWSDSDDNAVLEHDHVEGELEQIGRDMFAAIRHEIKQSGGTTVIRALKPWVYKVAATVLLVIASGIWWYNAVDSLNEIRTGFGEHRTVLLPDQSTVVLNGNSVLRYASNWDKDAPREVWIEGEGFFSVTHTASNQKFVVHGTQQLNVEVLGTKFNIKSRECSAEVVLTEGKLKVAVKGKHELNEVFLEPGDLATVKDSKLATRSVQHRRYTSWMHNKLILDRTSLKDLAVLLKETYGLSVAFETTGLENRTLSGEISSATADDILLAISQTLNLQVARDGKKVRVSTINSN